MELIFIYISTIRALRELLVPETIMDLAGGMVLANFALNKTAMFRFVKLGFR
jgi:hypothetical protein